jgi:hypothetical protein
MFQGLFIRPFHSFTPCLNVQRRQLPSRVSSRYCHFSHKAFHPPLCVHKSLGERLHITSPCLQRLFIRPLHSFIPRFNVQRRQLQCIVSYRYCHLSPKGFHRPLCVHKSLSERLLSASHYFPGSLYALFIHSLHVSTSIDVNYHP